MEITGQPRIANRLKVVLYSLYKNGKGENLLFVGPSGYGKTKLALQTAYYMANGMNFSYNIVNEGENIEPIFYGKEKVHILDEIHLMKETEILYPYMDLRSKILIFCSNIAGKLPEAFINRCVIFHFDEYSLPDLMKIALQSLEFELEEDKLIRLVEASGRNPRILLDGLVKQLNMVNESQPELLDDFDSLLLNLFGINENNLTEECIRYLTMLENVGGKCSLTRLSALLHLDQRYIETSIEPILLSRKFIKIGARGREKV